MIARLAKNPTGTHGWVFGLGDWRVVFLTTPEAFSFQINLNRGLHAH